MSLVEKYIETLTCLTGDPFEDEVSARLQGVVQDFQPISTKPNGDGGLDGLSDDCSVGYCCYGPELDLFKDEKELNADIVKKFKSDLRRLCELSSARDDMPELEVAENSSGAKPLVGTDDVTEMPIGVDVPKGKRSGKKGDISNKENKALAGIMPNGKKLKHIKLVLNRLETNKVYKPIFEAFQDYRSKSTLRFVEQTATFVILGPKDLAKMYAVDEMTINRARQAVLTKRVELAAELVALHDAKDFDHKIALLRQIRPTKSALIDELAAGWRAGWRLAIAAEQELDATSPSLHYALEQARLALLEQIKTFMFEAEEPWLHLSRAQEIARDILQKSFETVYGDLFPRMCHAEISKLIGDCPIRWEVPNA